MGDRGPCCRPTARLRRAAALATGSSRGPRVLRRARPRRRPRPGAVASAALLGLALATLLVAGMGGHAPAAGAGPLDAVVAEVDGNAVLLSDIALARALGLFGLEPSTGPIDAAAVERFVDIQLVLVEARRLTLTAASAEIERKWAEAAARFGGPAGLDRWLARAGVDPAWARSLVEAEVLHGQFVDLRFRAFVFVTEAEIDRVAGERGDEAARERARVEISRAAVARGLAEWTAAARKTSRVRIVEAGALPDPLPPSP
ncbi:MAG TPA: hypothetical protein VMT79_00895 [Candidatus Binatia bacterium]|nr:hypothetical protein [Candidatus Binatia bacterium]